MRFHFRSARLTLALLLGMAAPAASAAQEVRGATLDADGSVRVPGVIVLLVDSASRVVGRTLSSGAGDFRILAPAAGTYRIRALRIGFRPTLSEPFLLRTGAVAQQPVRLTGGAVQLAETRITGEAVCAAGGQGGESGLDAWMEARKALEASLLTRAQGYTMEVVRFTRRIGPAGGAPLAEQEDEYRAPIERPFASVSPNVLDARGFVMSEGGELAYNGPDEQVLLSERFAETHCMRMASSRNDDEVSIAFEPVRGRTVPEISGTITLARSGGLRRLDFHYVNVDADTRRAGAGGTIAFQPLPTGGWIVQQWKFRLPHFAQRSVVNASQPFAVRRPGESPLDIVLAGYQETGGEVLQVAQGDSVIWQRERPTLAGTVREQGGAGIPGAVVTIAPLGREARTDSAGRFAFESLRPARRTVRVRTGLTDSLGLPALAREMDSRRTGTVALELPRRAELVAGICEDSIAASTSALGFIRGRILGATGAAASAVAVEATLASALSTLGSRVGELQQRVVTHPEADGDFALCGVPLERRLQLRATAPDGRSAAVDVVVPSGSRLALATLALRAPEDVVTVAAATSTSASASAGTARLRGIVTAEVGGSKLAVGVAEAEVRVYATTDAVIDTARVAPVATARTDRMGRFSIDALAPRAYRLEARRLGYVPGSMSVDVTAGDTARVGIHLSRAAQVLATSVTSATRTYRTDFLDRNGYTERAEKGVGRFIGPEEIARSSRIYVEDLVRQDVKSVNGRTCMQVYVNGLRAHAIPRNLPITDVLGIEIYPRRINAPPQYTTSAGPPCGSIVIWTDPYREKP